MVLERNYVPKWHGQARHLSTPSPCTTHPPTATTAGGRGVRTKFTFAPSTGCKGRCSIWPERGPSAAWGGWRVSCVGPGRACRLRYGVWSLS